MDKVNLTFISNSNRAVLSKDVSVIFDGIKFTVKKGYKTDGASIPFIFWVFNLHPFQGDTLISAIFHDAFYETELYSRASIDNNFLFLMRKSGVGFLKRTLFYIAVRLFGGFVWSRHTVGSVTKARQFLMIKKI
jgi:hypothetical protein